MPLSRFPWTFPLVFLLAAAPARGSVEDQPPPGTILFPGLLGQQLLDSLRVNYRPVVALSYNAARDVMYTLIDNHGGIITAVYTGFQAQVDPQSTSPRADAFSRGINAEHTWPQSLGAEGFPAESDMHHLFPERIESNAARGNFPFDEIPDAQTDRWYRLNQEVTVPQNAVIDEYSELDNSHPDPAYAGRFEVREDHQGNTARAMFYFYTMYRAQADAEDPHYFQAQKDVLFDWHQEDAADDAEYERTCAVAEYQGGRVNPFIVDPTLVARAYFPDVPVVLASFAALPVREGVRLVWSTSGETDHLGFHVARRDEGPEWRRLTGELVLGGPRYEFLDRSAAFGATYHYGVESVSRDGSLEFFGPLTVTLPPLERLEVRAFPNPARGILTLSFALPAASSVRLTIHDAAGREVHESVAPDLPAGRHDLIWAGGSAPGARVLPGVYFYRLQAGDVEAAGKLTVIR
jgi:hypothetical protein